METADSYQYDKLTESGAMRLIVLQPCHDLAAPVRCSLISTTLQACHDDLVEKYTALSYVWGDMSQRREIVVDSIRLDITASLDLALRHVRDPVKIIRVWADGICINQQNILERNQQVAQMGLIYEIANHTIAFLGLATEQSNILMRAVGSLQILSKEMTPKIGLDYNQLQEALSDLLKYPWFTRVWTLQELVLSADPWIQCGDLRCRWDRLSKYIPWRKTSAMEDGMQPLRNMSEFRASSLKDKYTPWTYDSNADEKGAAALLLLLHSRRGLGATDPRDFIYAHLGMTSKDVQAAITIDYTKSYLTIYAEIARQILAWIPSLDILQLVGHQAPTRLLEGLPSWVPDWTLPIKRLLPSKFVIGLESAPRTQPGSFYRSLHSDSTLLVVPVKFLGTVESIIPTASLRDSESKNEVYNKIAIESGISDSATRILSDEDSQFQETMVYFYSIILAKSLGEKEKDMVLNTTNNDYQNLPPILLMLRGVIKNIQAIPDKSLPRSQGDGDLRANKLHDVFEALFRITKLYLWDPPARIALLSTGSLTCIPDNARIDDECFIDPSAGLYYGSNGRVTSIFVRRDNCFCMSNEDSAAFAQLVVQSEAKQGMYVPEPEAAGPFRLLARGEFAYVPSVDWVKELYMDVGVGERGAEVVLLS